MGGWKKFKREEVEQEITNPGVIVKDVICQHVLYVSTQMYIPVFI